MTQSEVEVVTECTKSAQPIVKEHTHAYTHVRAHIYTRIRILHSPQEAEQAVVSFVKSLALWKQ